MTAAHPPLSPGSSQDPAELRRAERVARQVVDPELPMLTLADLGVLRGVAREGETLVVTITPTYSGCPAMATMRDDLRHRLADAGFDAVEIRVALSPAWSSEWISEQGRRALHEHGISAPAPVRRAAGPVPLTLVPPARLLSCPLCDSRQVDLISEFGSTACKALYRCGTCGEPFDHVKEI